MNLYRILTPEEEKEFRQSARDNYNYNTLDIRRIWHPIYIDECNKMIQEEYERMKIEESNKTDN